MKQVFVGGLRKYTAILIAMLLVLTLLVPMAAAADSLEGEPPAEKRTAKEQTVLRVAFPQANGFSMTDADGHHSGIVVDFLNEIAKYTGWKYEYVDTNSDSLMDKFFAGEFDLVGGTYYAEEFEEYFGYPDYSCGYSRLILLARRNDHSVKSYDLNTLKGKTIGVYENNRENIRRLKEYLAINDLDCNLKYYNYEQLNVDGNLNQFLENGEVDLLLSNSSDIEDNFSVAVAFQSQPHYIVTQPGNQELLDELNMALERIYDADPNFAEKSYEANFPTTINRYSDLNEKELAYIEKKKSLTVAVPSDWHPLYCMDNGDNHDGLIPDILKEVADYSGLEFSYLLCDSYADALEKVLRGKADLLGFFVGTGEDASEQGLALSSSYVELDAILVRNKKSSYPAEGLTGSILEGLKTPADLVAEKIHSYSDTADALMDVNRGKVDYFYGISSHLEYIIQQENLTNVVQVNLINDSFNISFAMTSPADPELLTILNKAINNLSDEQKAAINGRNIISIGESHMTLSSIVYANPQLAILVITAFLGLALVVVILVSRSRLHAAVMRSELEKAEADSRAKSVFLSRMSHEIRTPMNAIVGLANLTETIDGLPVKAKDNLSKIKASSRYLLNLISDILDMSRIESGKMETVREPFSLRAILREIERMMEIESETRHITLKMEENLNADMLLGDAIHLRQVLLNLLSNAFKFTEDGGTVVVRTTEDDSSAEDATLTFRVIDNGVGIAPEDQQRIFDSFEQVGTNFAKSQGTGLGLAISSHIVRLMGGELKLKSQPGTGSEFYFTISLPKYQTNERNDSAPELAEAPEKILENVKILVAEDNDLNAEIAIELLRRQGASVLRAENGRKALAQFESSSPGTFQVILMDLLMPEMNGLEATRAIRALPRQDAGEIPIIAMTANAFKEDEEAALKAGMTGFISKPIDVPRLYQELRTALRPPMRSNETETETEKGTGA